MKTVKWKRVPTTYNPLFGCTCGGNFVLENNDLLISYQDFDNGQGRWEAAEKLLELVTGDSSQEVETALYNKVTDDWYILYGDFRKEYEKLFPKGFDACKKFFDKMKDKHGSKKWTTGE